MPFTINLDDNFPPGFYEEIGRLVIAFGRIEYILKLSIKTLIGEGFTKGMSEAESTRLFCKLCDRAIELAEKKLAETKRDDFIRIVTEIKNLAESRNDTIHAFWNGEPFLRIRLKWNKGKKDIEWLESNIPLEELIIKREELEKLVYQLNSQRSSWGL